MNTADRNARIEGCTAFVTGANQGIGKGFVEVLLERGARKIYAAARRPETLDSLMALDPARIVDLYSRIVTGHIFEALYAYDHLARPSRIKPLIAEGMPEHSPDRKSTRLNSSHRT